MAMKLTANQKAGAAYLLPSLAILAVWYALLLPDPPSSERPLDVLHFMFTKSPSSGWFQWLLALPVICIVLSLAFLSRLPRIRTGAIALFVAGLVLALAAWLTVDVSLAAFISLPVIFAFTNMRHHLTRSSTGTPDGPPPFDIGFMSLKAQAFSSEIGIEYTSDVESLGYVDGNVTVVIACSLDDKSNVHGIEAIFPEVTGFRLLDELDLARYWLSKDFPRGCHILEVERGGWSDEENKLQGFDTKRREWLVITGNACVSVFCSSEPIVKDVRWKFEP